MKIAFSTIACPAYGPEDMAEAVHKHGYDGIELYAAWGRTLTPALLASQLARIRQALRDVPIVALNSFATLGEIDAHAQAESDAALRQALELATELDCSLVKAFGGEVPPDSSRADITERAGARLASIVGRAEHLGVTIMIETHDGFSRGCDLGALLSLAPSPRIAALWDVHHPVRMGEPVGLTDAWIGDRVAHAHVKDAAREGDGWRFTALGDGELPVSEMLACLAGRGFDGVASVDYEKLWHPDLADPEESLPQHAEALRALIATAERRAATPTP